MLPRDELLQALMERGYQTLRSVREGNMSIALMTNGVHMLMLQEYADGGADLYAPLGEHNNLSATIDAIPVMMAGR